MTSGNEAAPSPDERQVFKVHRPEEQVPLPVGRREKIMVGTAGAALLAVGVYAGFGETVSMNMVDVDASTGTPQVLGRFRVDVQVSERCDELRKRYEEAVEAALASVRPGDSLASVPPERIAVIAEARKPFGKAPAGNVREVAPLFGDDPAASLRTGTSPAVRRWWGLPY